MTAEQLEELLGKVTQGEWSISGQPDKVCAEGYTKQGAAKVIVEVKEKSWMTATEQASNATLIALAPSHARRVICAEKLVEALEGLFIAESAAYFGPEGEKNKRAAERGARRKLSKSLTAYREACK